MSNHDLASKIMPFSTLPSSEPMVRAGLGALALNHMLVDEPPRVRELFHMTLDTPEEINTRLKDLFEINFPPMAVVHLYRQLDVPAHHLHYILDKTDLFVDTVIFNLKDRLPLDASYQDVFGQGVHQREETFLVFTQGGHSHFFKCGGDRFNEIGREFFTEFGKVAPINLGPIIEDYNQAKVKDEEFVGLDEVETRQKKWLNWMIANALIANLTFTTVSIAAN